MVSYVCCMETTDYSKSPLESISVSRGSLLSVKGSASDAAADCSEFEVRDQAEGSQTFTLGTGLEGYYAWKLKGDKKTLNTLVITAAQRCWLTRC